MSPPLRSGSPDPDRRGNACLRATRFQNPADVVLSRPDIGTTASKAGCLKAHRLKRHISSKDHEIGPENLLAILLLDGPEQATRRVKIAVVRPTVERSKSLNTVRSASATTYKVTNRSKDYRIRLRS